MALNSILHIGMPKCMSTSIQAWLRTAESVTFMGIGPSKHVDPEVLHVFQRQIVATPAMFYNKEIVARVFDNWISQAVQRDSKLFALSDESIPYPLAYGRGGTSYIERLERLRDAMPRDTSVLMITRRPKDYLRSAYKHRVTMNGMTLSFEEYVKRLLLLGDTYFLSTVKFFQYAREAERIFGNIRVVAMEDVEDDVDTLLSVFKNLGARGGPTLPRENIGMSNEAVDKFRTLQVAFGNSLDDDDFNVMSPATRRVCAINPAYFGTVLAQALAKEQMLASLRNLAGQIPTATPKISFDLSDESRRLLKEYVASSNTGLKAQYGIDIDAYNYNEF
jgi:hypothetical protein